MDNKYLNRKKEYTPKLIKSKTRLVDKKLYSRLFKPTQVAFAKYQI